MEEVVKHIIKFFMSINKFITEHLDEIIISLITTLIAALIGFYFNKLKKSIQLLFSNTLRSKRGKLESIKIEGAITINRPFLRIIERDGEKQNFKPDDFYLAKLTENCQWYGILKGWGIKRDTNKRILGEIKQSFADEFRQPKIIGVITGRGGSGKSTLLRQIAVDSVQEDFCILWINDNEIQKFYDNGLDSLGNYSKTKFLILIEDWYRIRQKTSHAKEIIDNICNYSNIRVIIGDRTLDKSVSREHIYNPVENIIELEAKENRDTISKILEKVDHWKGTAKKLLKTDNDYDSTLYLILWVIARTYQDQINKIPEKSIIMKEGLAGHFQTIVESDLRAIAKHYPGLAKALYYYGSFYTEDRIYLGLDTFMSIAELFNEEYIDNKLAFSSDEVNPILNIYIHTKQGIYRTAGELPLVAFNQDLLSDDGISKAQIDGWHRFDKSIRLKILPVIIDKGDGFSASNYFLNSLNKIGTDFFPNPVRLEYLNKLLFDKKNRGYYLFALFNGSIILNEVEKKSYISAILKDFLNYYFSTPVICACLKDLSSQPDAQKVAATILSPSNLITLPHSVVNTAFKISTDEEVRKRAITTILSPAKLFTLPHHLVSTALKFASDDIRQRAITTILSQPNKFSSYNQIVSTAIIYATDDWKRQEAITSIFSQPKFFKLPHHLVSTAMKLSCDNEQQKAASTILSQPDILELSKDIVITAMKISKNEEERQKVASQILSHPEFFELRHHLVSTALKISKDEKKRREVAAEILSKPYFHELPHHIVATAISISSDTIKAEYFLGNWEKTNWSIVYQSLFCYAQNQEYPQFVVDIVHKIISESKNKRIFRKYSQLLKIPFHGINEWQNECNNIINNYWNKPNALLLNSVLYSHRSHPQKIKNICSTLLTNWKEEIIRPIKLFYGGIHYGDNIKIAMGHPELKILARQTAMEILSAEAKKPRYIRDYLLVIARSIINDEKYPEWDLLTDHEDF